MLPVHSDTNQTDWRWPICCVHNF